MDLRIFSLISTGNNIGCPCHKLKSIITAKMDGWIWWTIIIGKSSSNSRKTGSIVLWVIITRNARGRIIAPILIRSQSFAYIGTCGVAQPRTLTACIGIQLVPFRRTGYVPTSGANSLHTTRVSAAAGRIVHGRSPIIVITQVFQIVMSWFAMIVVIRSSPTCVCSRLYSRSIAEMFGTHVFFHPALVAYFYCMVFVPIIVFHFGNPAGKRIRHTVNIVLQSVKLVFYCPYCLIFQTAYGMSDIKSRILRKKFAIIITQV